MVRKEDKARKKLSILLRLSSVHMWFGSAPFYNLMTFNFIFLQYKSEFGF